MNIVQGDLLREVFAEIKQVRELGRLRIIPYLRVDKETKKQYPKTRDIMKSMKKNPFKKLRIGSYLRELSVVIIGIGITLYASNLVASCNGQRNLDAQLKAIYAELRENNMLLEEHIETLKRYVRFRDMITSYTTSDQPIPQDSVAQYANLLDIGIGSTLYKHSAYDLLLYSGNMLLIKDKKRLAAIGNCYADLELINKTWDVINSMKREMLMSLYSTGISLRDIDFNKPEWRKTRNFYSEFIGGQGHALETQREIAEVLDGK